jgi:hypothetical protein
MTSFSAFIAHVISMNESNGPHTDVLQKVSLQAIRAVKNCNCHDLHVRARSS